MSEDYAKLLEELNGLPPLAKSEAPPAAAAPPAKTAEEEAAEAAAETAAEAEAAAEAAAAAAEKGAGGEAEPVVAKALRVTRPDGTEVEGFDATESIEALQADLAAANDTIAAQGALLSKSASFVKSLHETVSGQGAAIDALRAEMAAMGRKGAGPKGVFVKSTPPAAGAAAPKTGAPKELPYAEVMAKALSLQAEGKIGGNDVNRIEAYRLRGLGVPEDLVPHFAG